MAGGGGGLKLKVINLFLEKPVLMYLGGAAAVHTYRWYSTKTTYNYWFGMIEYNRRLERNQL